MSSKVIQHAGKLQLPQHLCEEFHQIPETCIGKPGGSASISAAKKCHEPYSAGYDKMISIVPKFTLQPAGLAFLYWVTFLDLSNES